MKLLIVEDEKELAASIVAYINNEGYYCDLVYIKYDYDNGYHKILIHFK